MMPDRWTQIKMVMAQVLDTPMNDRAAFLDRACGADHELRREVESLLAAGDASDSLPGARDAIAAAARAMTEDPESDARSVLEGALGRQYDILQPLGRGGMGHVYLARERELDRFVAIKILHPDLAATNENRERFRREARIAAQLTHPGILRLHSFGEVEGVWYFVMGYVRGETLAERLRLEGRMPWTEALRLITDVADALEYAHRRGVIHRDIKPANILLDEESGHAVLADFGISKWSGVGETLTATGVVIGTPDYMSPEQCVAASDLDERSDIYSLGAVAYRMLAGREPFVGLDAAAVIYRRLSQDPLPLNAVQPSVPDALASVVMRCLLRDRSARWRNVTELKSALARVEARSAEALPEEVRELPSFGPYAGLWAVAWTMIALLTVRPWSERILLLLIALLVPVGLTLHVWNVGRHGLRLTEIARVACWPPEWWGMWWPRALRRPSDLWSRLPWPARFVRATLSALFVVVPGLIVLRQWLALSGRITSGAPIEQAIIATEVIVVIVAAAIVVAAFRWSSRKGLSTPESAHLLLGATTTSPSWNTHNVSRLLGPHGRVRSPDRDSPADYRRAIGEILALIPVSAFDDADAAISAADRLVRGIDAHDRELATLSRDATTADADRLAAQLASLSDPSSGDNSERRELRELVRHQLDVVRRIRAHHEALSRKRARLFDLLRGLWAQLCGATDARDRGTEVSGDDDVRMRALRAEIDAEVPDEPRGSAGVVAELSWRRNDSPSRAPSI